MLEECMRVFLSYCGMPLLQWRAGSNKDMFRLKMSGLNNDSHRTLKTSIDYTV